MKKILIFSLIMIFIVLLVETTATATTSTEKITLNLWDTWTHEGANVGMDKMVSKYQEENPNIEIVRTTQQRDDMRLLLQTALSSGTGPDIFYYDVGPGYAGVLAKAGLLLPLDSAYNRENGFGSRIFGWTKERSTYDGKVYGIANEMEFIGVYYNKKIFNELGVGEPKTYEEFIQICDKAKAAGYIPIAFADAGKWPAFHQFSIMANNIAGKEKIDKVLFGDGTWDDPDFIKAIQTFFVDMNKAGYFPPDPVAIKYEDGNALFYSGKAAMDITGSWLITEMVEAKDFEVGFFFFPSIEGKPILPPAGLGSGFLISSKTAHPEEAIKFLDYLFSEENDKKWLEDMCVIPPVAVKTENLNITPLMKFAVNALSKPMGYNIDVLAGDQFNNVQGDGFQAVLIGRKTPEQLVKELQAAWEADKIK